MTGTTTCAVGERDGQVVLQFPESVQWAAFDPETARQIGEAMARSAYKVRFGSEPTKNASILSDQVRTRLHAQVTIMLRSMINRRDLPGVIAQEVVDAVLREVT